MSDQAQPTQPVATAPVPAPVPATISIKTEAKEQIKAKNATIRETVIERLVEAELDNRATILAKAIEDREKKDRDLKKIKPDNVVYDAATSEKKETYTAAKFEERKKAQEAINKLDKAIDAALAVDPNWDELKKQYGQSNKEE